EPGEDSRPEADRDERKYPREQVEPVPRRFGEDRRAELGDELLLDLAPGVAGGDPRGDEAADPVRDRRARLVEGGLTGRAHHLAFELAERGMLLARRRRCRQHQRQEEQRREPHDCRACWMPAVSFAAVISPATRSPTSRPRRSTK